MCAYHLERIAPLALGLSFANANDGRESCPVSGLRLGADILTGLAMIGAALGVSDDYRTRPGIGENFGSPMNCVRNFPFT